MEQSEMDRRNRETIGRILWLSHKHWQQTSQRMEEIGIGGGAGALLLALRCHGEMSQTELAKRMDVTAATVSQTLKPLEKAGLVERSGDEADARVLRVKLTEAGQSKSLEAEDVFRTEDTNILSALTDTEIETLAELLQKLERKMRGENA